MGWLAAPGTGVGVGVGLGIGNVNVAVLTPLAGHPGL